jgi:hypothetical protein
MKVFIISNIHLDKLALSSQEVSVYGQVATQVNVMQSFIWKTSKEIYQDKINIGKGKVVPVLNLIKHYAMKAYGRVDV